MNSLWSTEFDSPMPDDMDYWEFNRLRQRKWDKEDVVWQSEFLKSISGTNEEYANQQAEALHERIQEKIKHEVEDER